MKYNKIIYAILIGFFLTIIYSDNFAQGTGTIVVHNQTVPASSGIDFYFELNYGEPIKIEILTPSTIAGNYTAKSANFGPLVMNTSLNGDIQLADPIVGTPAPLADLTGKIALIERGSDTYFNLVTNAQNAGAIAVIVYNNQPGGALVNMTGGDPSITIPSYFISNEDGLLIKNTLPANVNVTISTGIKDRFILQHGNSKTISSLPAGNHSIDIYEPFFSSLATGYMIRSLNIVDPSGGSSVESFTANIDLAADETVEVTFIYHKPVYANLKIFLEGPYNTSNGNMNKNLNFYESGEDLIPYFSPYLADQKNRRSYPQNWVDWILVELRDKNNSSTLIASRSAMLLNDGTIVDTDGVSPVAFNVDEGDYYIVVTHRNHLPIMSKIPVHLSIPSVTVSAD